MKEEKIGFKKWVPLAVVVLALFIIILDATVINVSIKSIIGDLNTDLKTVQWVITGYSLMLAAFTITGGRLGDIFGRKRMFKLGAVIFGVGSLMAAMSHSSTMLMISVSLIEGLGAALMMPATSSILLSEYKGKDRAVAFGAFGAVAGVGSTVGPLVGGFLTSNYSWRWNYLINPFVVLLLLFGSKFLHESREKKAHKADGPSILFSAFGLASIVYGVIESSTYGWLKAKNDYEIFGGVFHLLGVSVSVYTIAFGLIFLVAFLYRQRKLEDAGKFPLVSLEIFKNSQFMAGTSVTAIVAMAQMGMFFAMPIFLQGMLNKDAFHTGIAMAPFSLSVLFAAPLSGILVSKKNVQPKLLIQIGLVFSLVGSIMMRQAFSVDATVMSIVPSMIVFAFGFGLAFSQLSNLTLSAVSVRQAGESSGVNNTFRQIGATVGQALIGALLITALVAQLTSDVNASKVLPSQYKNQMAAQISTSATSLGTSGAEQLANLPAPIVKEVNDIKNAAIIKGVKTALLPTIGFIALALALTVKLPSRLHEPEDLDAAVVK